MLDADSDDPERAESEIDAVEPEHDATDDRADHHHDHDRDPPVDDRHDELRREQAAAPDRAHEQVPQVPPRRLTRDRIAGEQ